MCYIGKFFSQPLLEVHQQSERHAPVDPPVDLNPSPQSSFDGQSNHRRSPHLILTSQSMHARLSSNRPPQQMDHHSIQQAFRPEFPSRRSLSSVHVEPPYHLGFETHLTPVTVPLISPFYSTRRHQNFDASPNPPKTFEMISGQTNPNRTS